jgi:hypothetical protein
MRDCDVNGLRRVRAHGRAPVNSGEFHCVPLSSIGLLTNQNFSSKRVLLAIGARKLVRCLACLSKRNNKIHQTEPQMNSFSDA